MKYNKSAISHPTFFNRYVDSVGAGEIRELLKKSLEDLEVDLAILADIDFNQTYADGKWTIAILIRHCIDAEIIFTFRSLAIARGEKKPIISFDENDYARESESTYDKTALIDEFLNARKASAMLFNSFKEEWINTKVGKTDLGDHISLLSLGHIIIGHWLHHKKVLIEKYGINF